MQPEGLLNEALDRPKRELDLDDVDASTASKRQKNDKKKKSKKKKSKKKKSKKKKRRRRSSSSSSSSSSSDSEEERLRLQAATEAAQVLAQGVVLLVCNFRCEQSLLNAELEKLSRTRRPHDLETASHHRSLIAEVHRMRPGMSLNEIGL